MEIKVLLLQKLLNLADGMVKQLTILMQEKATLKMATESPIKRRVV